MYFGQTSNWKGVVDAVTEEGTVSYPAIAAQYADNVNAIRIHCGGREKQVQMHVQLFLVTEEDIEAFDAFLKRFALPRNGYVVFDTQQPYPYSASAPLLGFNHTQSTPMIEPPANNRQPY